MRVILNVNDNEWGFLSTLLKRFDFVRIQQVDKSKAETVGETLTFKATQLDTVGFTFNREEANERYQFIDTNVLIYCYTSSKPDKQRVARRVASEKGRYVSTQVLQELANTLRRKFKKDWLEIGATLQEITSQFTVHQNTAATIRDAIRSADRYGYSFYDSLIVAAALESGCSILYSEDMQSGQLIDGTLTIHSPFQ